LGQSAPPCGEQEEEIVARTYLNLEKEQIVTVLDLFAEIQARRELTHSEKFVRETLNIALDNLASGW
jgi:hypothetical protein